MHLSALRSPNNYFFYSSFKRFKKNKLYYKFSLYFTGMAWNFRLSTLNKKEMSPIMVLPRHPHFEIAAWLEVLELPQYNGMFNYFCCCCKMFASNIVAKLNPEFKKHFFSFLSRGTESFSKFIGLEELMYFCEADIKQLGVRNSAHRARIVSSLVAFRDKYKHGKLNKKKVTVITFACVHFNYLYIFAYRSGR